MSHALSHQGLTRTAEPPRRPPRGYGLAIAAIASAGLWVAVFRGVSEAARALGH